MADDQTLLLKTTALHAVHLGQGARMCAFAGYDMPLQYEGVLAEHRWTRTRASLFDVSHMGPALLVLDDPTGDVDADHRAIASLIEPLTAGDIQGLRPGQIRYTQLLNDDGGVIDDLFVGRLPAGDAPGRLMLVVNGAVKEGDFVRIARALFGRGARLKRLDRDHSLIALQGPEAADALEPVLPGVSSLGFMRFLRGRFGRSPVLVSRSGYTGEDGFEILITNGAADALWRRLLEDERVRPAGLAARDSLRLEAGLPLYGHDLDETVSPVEAGLNFSISQRRLEALGIPGARRIAAEAGGALERVRVGLKVLEGGPAREGAEVQDLAGATVGRVTSGGFSPTLGGPIALAFAPPQYSHPGSRLRVIVRGKAQLAEVVPLPFVPHRYVRQPQGGPDALHQGS